MSKISIRSLSDEEHAHISDILTKCREHFHEWKGHEGGEHGLIAFAFYEGGGGSDHCGQILANAAPFALGKELVEKYGFTWHMVKADESGFPNITPVIEHLQASRELPRRQKNSTKGVERRRKRVKELATSMDINWEF